MNWVDLVVLTVLTLSGLLAFMRGLVREVLGVGAWVLAGVIASPLGAYPYVQPLVRERIADPTIAELVAYGGVFIVALIVLWLVASSVGAAVRDSMLGGLDRTLGLVFGLVRGAAVVAVFYILVGLAVPAEQWPPAVVEAALLPTVHRGANWIAAQMPEGYRPKVAAPPEGRPTTSAALLQPKAVGRAQGGREARE